MKNVTKFVNTIRVPFSDTGVGKGFSVIGAARIIEDNVCSFFASFGRDSASIKAKYNAVWVFVKNKFRIKPVVCWNEQVTVESYFTQTSAATVVVDTAVFNASGEVAVSARTEICAMDIVSQRIRRISSLEMPEVTVYESEAGFSFTRFDTDGLNKIYAFTVPSTSIDCCMHMNNVEYLRFIFNSSSVEKELKNPVRETEIRFVNQSREGDELTLFGGTDGNKEVFVLKNGDKTVVKCGVLRSE